MINFGSGKKRESCVFYEFFPGRESASFFNGSRERSESASSKHVIKWGEIASKNTLHSDGLMGFLKVPRPAAAFNQARGSD